MTNVAERSTKNKYSEFGERLTPKWWKLIGNCDWTNSAPPEMEIFHAKAYINTTDKRTAHGGNDRFQLDNGIHIYSKNSNHLQIPDF